MKTSDFVFEYISRERPFLCRVRVFSNASRLYVVLTNIEGVYLSGSVTNSTEDIHRQLREFGYVISEHQTIEHYEEGMWSPADFDIVKFDEIGNPSWTKITLGSVIKLLGCSKDEFITKTCDVPRLFHRIEKLTHHLAPFSGVESFESPEKLARRLEIDDSKRPKSELNKLIENGAGERALQTYLKTDLTYFSEMYARLEDEYICFPEFPVGDGFVDFAVFTGRSRMEVILIEIKGANFKAVTNGGYRNFSAKFNECVQQARRRNGYIGRNYNDFRLHVHRLREQAENGKFAGKCLIGPAEKLLVDPNKDVKPYVVCIAGIGDNDMEESKARHDMETETDPPLRIETWNSWIAKLKRGA